VRRLLLVLIGLSALVAFAAGGALATARFLAPDWGGWNHAVSAYHLLLAGFGILALCGASYGLLSRTTPSVALPIPARPLPVQRPSVKSDASALFHQMRTYVDLEMWELALDKANGILSQFPGSREAEIVSRNINEIRWKAEPKFVTRSAEGVSAAEERKLQARGLEQMLKHVRTYMELEMWDLAKQKALAILQHFPDSDEATQATPLYQEIEKKLQEHALEPVRERRG